MGDVLSSVFGGGSDSSQQVTVDPTTQQLNQLRLQQAGELFGTGGLAGFARPGGDGAYEQSPAVSGLQNYAYNAGNVQPALNFQDWFSQGTNRDLLNLGFDRGEGQLQRTRGQTAADFNAARDSAGGMFNNIYGLNQGEFGNAYGRNADEFANAYQRNQDQYSGVSGGNVADYNALLGTNRDIFGQAMSQGLNSTSNYINQVATPAIMQQMALAGLDSSGAVPMALSRATAEAGLPLMQSLLPAYMGEQAGLGQNFMGMQGALGQNLMGMQGQLSQGYMGEQGQLGGQYLGRQGELGQNYGNTMADLMRTYGLTDTATMQGAMQGDRGLLQSYIPQEMGFLSGAPGVASQYAMLPYQAGGLAAQNAATLFPMADQQRSLREQDLIRRQGLSTTAFTGLPYTPSTSTEQGTNTKPLFNLFGFG